MRRRNGFTLVELLVSLSIFSLLAVAVYSVFAGGVGTWRRAQVFSSTYQTARLVLDKIGRDLGRTVRISGSEFSGGPARLSFLTVRPVVAPPDDDAPPASGGGAGGSFLAGADDAARRQAAFPIRRVTYLFEASSLMRRDESYLEGLQDVHRDPEVMAGPFAGVTFQYASKDDDRDAAVEWLEQWEDAEKNPSGVKITLTIGDDQRRPLRLTKTVFFLQSVVEKQGDGARPSP